MSKISAIEDTIQKVNKGIYDVNYKTNKKYDMIPKYFNALVSMHLNQNH